MFGYGQRRTRSYSRFSWRGNVLSHPRSEMRDISEHVIGNFGTSILDIKLRPPSGAANCRVAPQVGRVSKHVSSFGKLSDSGNDPLEMDTGDYGLSYLVLEAIQGRVLLK